MHKEDTKITRPTGSYRWYVIREMANVTSYQDVQLSLLSTT